jgi:hypothetical protein
MESVVGLLPKVSQMNPCERRHSSGFRRHREG